MQANKTNYNVMHQPTNLGLLTSEKYLSEAYFFLRKGFLINKQNQQIDNLMQRYFER